MGPWLLWNVNRKSQVLHETMIITQVADRSVSVPMTLSDLKMRDVRGQIFPADLLNNTRTD